MGQRPKLHMRIWLAAALTAACLAALRPIPAAAMQHENTTAPTETADLTADVETAADWEATFAEVELTGDYAADLICIAMTQVGYTESATNYIIDASGDVKGYTRYGAWYGIPYGDWCAMFVSFCLCYAGVPEEVFPWDGSCDDWIKTLSSPDYNLYADIAYTPREGDLVFFDWDGDGAADHVGIVTGQAEDGSFQTINGNLSGKVKTSSFFTADSTVLGYGILPLAAGEEPEEAEEAEEPETTVTPAVNSAASADTKPEATEQKKTEESAETETIDTPSPEAEENTVSPEASGDAGSVSHVLAIAEGAALLAVLAAGLLYARRRKMVLERLYQSFAPGQKLDGGRTMTDKELRRLSRIELLQMLTNVSRESEHRAEALEDLRQQMEENKKQIRAERADEVAMLRQSLEEAKQRMAELETNQTELQTEQMRKMLESMVQEVKEEYAVAQTQTREDVDCLREQLDIASKARSDAVGELATVKRQLAEAENRLSEAQAQSHEDGELELVKTQLAETERRLAETEGQLAEAEQKLAERSILLENAGSVAEAAVQISGVLEAAQSAADTFLENAKKVYEKEARKQYREMQARMQEMEQLTRQKCLLMLREAQRRARNTNP